MSRPRPARTSVRHGMASCARYGCDRDECQRAYRIAHTRQEMDRAQGITGRVDAAATRARVAKLLLAGMSIGDIAQRSGVSPTSVRAINRGAYTRIYRTTQDAIRGIPIPKATTTPIVRGYVTAIGSQRRLQALAALGWTREALSARTGLSARTIGDIRRGDQARVFIDHHQAIVGVYEELWNQHPEDHEISANTASRLRAFALRSGWKRPADLDDDHIDWPDTSTARKAAA